MAKRQPVQIKELAAHYGLHRSTIHRMLIEIEAELDTPVEHDSDGRVWIDHEKYQLSVRLTLNEALAVFLASRLLARYSDKPNPYAVKALRGLSQALRKTAPRIASHIARTSDKLDRPLSETARDHLRVLEALTRAWAEGTRVRLVTRDKPEIERLFEPYFIEPSAVGYSSYVIGFDHYRGEVRTHKIERLLRALPTLDTYTIPATFDPYQKLAGAWGVNWGKDGEVTEVTLRFAAGRAADRVRETNWHREVFNNFDPFDDSETLHRSRAQRVGRPVCWLPLGREPTVDKQCLHRRNNTLPRHCCFNLTYPTTSWLTHNTFAKKRSVP